MLQPGLRLTSARGALPRGVDRAEAARTGAERRRRRPAAAMGRRLRHPFPDQPGRAVHRGGRSRSRARKARGDSGLGTRVAITGSVAANRLAPVASPALLLGFTPMPRRPSPTTSAAANRGGGQLMLLNRPSRGVRPRRHRGGLALRRPFPGGRRLPEWKRPHARRRGGAPGVDDRGVKVASSVPAELYRQAKRNEPRVEFAPPGVRRGTAGAFECPRSAGAPRRGMFNPRRCPGRLPTAPVPAVRRSPS